jgi:hypothetical protein
MPDTYKWGIVTILPDGHRIFPDRHSERVAIADNSGLTPQNTDDGILWLDFKRPLILGVDASFDPAREYHGIPVVDQEGNEARTGSNMSTLMWLSMTFDWPIYDERQRTHYQAMEV